MFSKYEPPIRTFPHIPAASRDAHHGVLKNPEAKVQSRKSYNRAQLVEIHQVEVKVQPFAYQIGHFVLEVFYGRPGLKALNRGCLRPTSESLTLSAYQRASLPWGNGAEGAAASSSYPARPRTGRACSEKVWAWGAPPVGSYRRRLPLPDCFPCSTPRPRVASSLTTRPAPSAHRVAHQEVLWCSR